MGLASVSFGTKWLWRVRYDSKKDLLEHTDGCFTTDVQSENSSYLDDH